MEKKVDNSQLKNAVSKKDIVITVILSVLCVFMIVVILLNIFVFENATVSGNSMNNTLLSGDVIYYNKLGKAERGDIVIIDKGSYLVVKRVIAVGGDTVTIKDGNLYLNGSIEPLVENYVTGENYSNVYTQTYEEKTWVVNEGEIFYLGDNRSVSVDSRANGTIGVDSVLGTVSDFAVKTKGIKTFFANLFGPNCSNMTGE